MTNNELGLVLETTFGLRVSFDDSGRTQVFIPELYKYKMCGLCGNFDGKPQNDMRINSEAAGESGYAKGSVDEFVDTWKEDADEKYENG